MNRFFLMLGAYKKAAAIAAIILLAGGFIGSKFLFPKTEPVTEEALIKEVKIASVLTLHQETDPLPLLGTVSSKSEVTLRAEAQGALKGVYKKQGQYVNAGGIIAEIENSRERAAVLQAEAGLDAAKAGLSILQLQSGNAESALQEAKTASINTITSAYATADDVIRNKADQFFSNPRSGSPQITFPATDSNLEGRLEWNRFLIEQTLVSWSEQLRTLSLDTDLFSALGIAEKNLRQIQTFLDDAALAVNTVTSSADLSQATIDAWRASVLLARTSINGALASVSLAKDNLNGKITAYEVSKKQGGTSSSGGELLQGEATVKQALAGLKLAESNLEKTIIRAPISGTLNSLSIEQGDLVSVFESVGVIANNGTLKITAYITEEDRGYIRVGSKALISGDISGTVIEIAPAIDPKTKKIEITIVPKEAGITLTNGESVEVSLTREDVSGTNNSQSSEWVIPISAVKISAEGPFVYSVNSDNHIVALPVIVGPIIGKDILITSGLSADTEIVIDARGLREGETITPLR